MRYTVWALVFVLSGAGLAVAQDGERNFDGLRREFERRMQDLDKRFREEREKLEREFKAQREKFMPPRTPEGERPQAERPQSSEELLRRILDRVQRLEDRIDRGLREIQRLRSFDFERFVPPRFREFMPRFKDRDFEDEFRRGERREEGRERDERKEEPRKPRKREGDGF